MRTRLRGRPALLVALVAALLAGCVGQPSTGANVGHVASLAELLGPWRREPMLLDAAMLARADQACRQDPEFPIGVSLVAIDVRGGRRLLPVYVGGNSYADCVYVEVNPAGTVTGSLSTKGSGMPDAPAAGKVIVTGGGGVGRPGDPAAWSSVIGRAGPGVARVVVDVPGVGPVTATLQNGWYIAWWDIVGKGRYTVRAYDAAGTVTDTLTP